MGILPSSQTLDDLDQLMRSETLTTSEVHQLASPDNDCRAFRRSGNRHPSSPAELEQTFVPQEPKGTENGIGVDTQDRSEVLGGRHAFAGRSFSVSDGASDLGGHLFVESHRVGTVNLDMLNDAIAHSTMSLQVPIRPAEPVADQTAQPIEVARRI